MRFWVGLATLFLLGLALICFGLVATAYAATPTEVASAALSKGHPCAGRLDVRQNPVLAQRGENGHAVGAETDQHGTTDTADDTLRLVSCRIDVDPVAWVEGNAQDDCEVLVHEAIHLDQALRGQSLNTIHAASGVMVPGGGYWPACAPVENRVATRVLGLAPDGWGVVCLGRVRRVIRCEASHGRRTRVYRARVWRGATTIDGFGYTLKRVKSRVR